MPALINRLAGSCDIRDSTSEPDDKTRVRTGAQTDICSEMCRILHIQTCTQAHTNDYLLINSLSIYVNKSNHLKTIFQTFDLAMFEWIKSVHDCPQINVQYVKTETFMTVWSAKSYCVYQVNNVLPIFFLIIIFHKIRKKWKTNSSQTAEETIFYKQVFLLPNDVSCLKISNLTITSSDALQN